MLVEPGKRFFAGRHFRNTFDGSHYITERRLASKDNADSAAGEDGEVSRELNGIAEALLGVDEECFAGDVGAIPGSGGKLWGFGGIDPGFEAPFVLAPAVEEVAGHEERVGKGEVEVGIFGVEGNGGLVGGEHGRKIAFQFRGGSEGGVRLCEIGIKLERPPGVHFGTRNVIKI